MRETRIREGDYKRTCLCGESSSHRAGREQFTQSGERAVHTERGETSSHRAGRD